MQGETLPSFCKYLLCDFQEKGEVILCHQVLLWLKKGRKGKGICDRERAYKIHKKRKRSVKSFKVKNKITMKKKLLVFLHFFNI
jgi:hypothetical protein